MQKLRNIGLEAEEIQKALKLSLNSTLDWIPEGMITRSGLKIIEKNNMIDEICRSIKARACRIASYN